ncbi:MAG: hypothetical protein ABSG68_13190 [Thermoguttaceae bacterium]|jgi:hypothetical protein
MQLDRQHIVIRERSFSEVLDLALRVLRVHGGPLCLALAAGIVPAMLLNAWLLSGVLEPEPDAGDVAGYLWWMFLLVMWECPLATALATLYLGQAMFSRRPEAAKVAKDFGKSLPQLLWYQVLLRGLLLPWMVTWILPYAVWPYLNEVILLERNPWRRRRKDGMTSGRRSRVLHAQSMGDLFVRWLGSVACGGMLVLSIWASLYCLGTLLLGEREPGAPVYTVYYPLALWIMMAIFTVVRFLGYTDLRIRREGWEVELAMRAEGDRLMRQWT